MSKSKTHRNTKKLRKNKRASRKNVMKGGYGPSNFSELSSKYYYPVNNYNNDPNNPTTMQSEHLSQPVIRGGNKKTQKTQKNTRKHK